MLLSKSEDVYILTHINPDGDTLGSGFALAEALRMLGKRANVLCSDDFPMRYLFLFDTYKPQEFEPKTIVAVDIADTQLLGSKLSAYKDSIDLCIDHHISNTMFAKRTLLDDKASAACEVIYDVLAALEIPMNLTIAKCLYTGIATDTGCFKYSNTTPKAHIITSELMEFPINFPIINHLMFDMKSKGRLIAEQHIINTMEFHYHDMCALIVITQQLIEDTKVGEAEFEGLASLPRQIEGVQIGVTIKEKAPNYYKVSMRSSDLIDVSALCQRLGGGGHARAAGCVVEADLETTKSIVLDAVGKVLGLKP